MAFLDPNAPIIARQFATDVAPNRRIEMQSNPANVINFFAGIPESSFPGYIKVDGNAGQSFMQMAAPRITGSSNNLNEIQLFNGPTPAQAGLFLTFNQVIFQTPTGGPVTFVPNVAGYITVDKPIKTVSPALGGGTQFNFVPNTQDALTADGVLRFTRGNASFTVAADGSISIPHNLGALPQTGFISVTNSSQVATYDVGGSSASNAKVFIRSITAAGALVAAGTVVAVRYLFTT